mmetsp:Transcript_83133/g.144448  ORF Transcript_83133/g.144448 Transcript_83133/m.144448 type:complete len:125 (+) Transcript_83133:173-547(+)
MESKIVAGSFVMISALKNGAAVAALSIVGYILWLLLVQHWIPLHLRSKGSDKHGQQSSQVDEEEACVAEEDRADPEVTRDHVHNEARHFSGNAVPNKDLAPGLALLEQYSVFGVPSGSWSARHV